MKEIKDMKIGEYLDCVNNNYNVFAKKLEEVHELQKKLIIKIEMKEYADRAKVIMFNIFKTIFEPTKGKKGMIIEGDEYKIGEKRIQIRNFRCHQYNEVWSERQFKKIFLQTKFNNVVDELCAWAFSENIFKEVLETNECVIDTPVVGENYLRVEKDYATNNLCIKECTPSSIRTRVVYREIKSKDKFKIEESQRYSFDQVHAFIDPVVLAAHLEHLNSVEEHLKKLELEFGSIDGQFESFLERSGLDQYELLSKI